MEWSGVEVVGEIATKLLLIFDKMHIFFRLPRETTSERPKELCTLQLLFFRSDLDTCFVPWRRALFRHLNFPCHNGVQVFISYFDLLLLFPLINSV